MKSCLISVIVPVFNTERYLNKCIDSILAQTVTDFELLLIDDGSSDSSGRICDEYASKDSRIQVYHKPNGGVCSARNMGLEKASGEFVAFADSDDWLDNDYLECLLHNGQEDFVCCSFVVENTSCTTDWNILLSDCNDSQLALEKNLTKFSFCSVCCKLFKKKLLTNGGVRFNEQLSQMEDGLFVFEYLCSKHCTIRTMSKTAYHYRYDYKNRNNYTKFPIQESYLLMGLLSVRLKRIHELYACSNAWYLQCEVTCSQMYNIYRTISDSKQNIYQKTTKFLELLRNRHVRSMLTNRQFMKMKRRGMTKYYLLRLLYAFI